MPLRTEPTRPSGLLRRSRRNHTRAGARGAQPRLRRLRILAAPANHHPTVVEFALHRTADVKLRLADAITWFAGSMPFVYLHVIAFAIWMLLLEHSPWPTLTLVVSLEAIFLSTFVMIGQNRQAAFHQAKADHEFQTEEQELHENTDLTREIHRLTVQLHAMQTAMAASAAGRTLPLPEPAGPTGSSNP
jgi:uncharacterized membrane protein